VGISVAAVELKNRADHSTDPRHRYSPGQFHSGPTLLRQPLLNDEVQRFSYVATLGDFSYGAIVG
jgi:hypothetical protein